MNLSVLNPYALWIKIAAVVLAVVGLFCSGLWLRGVIAERDALRVSESLQKETVKMYADAWHRNEQFQKGVADAVKNIHVVSNNYIQSVEDAPPPAVPDG